MVNPLTDIENLKAQLDTGIMAYRIFEGAISEGATPEQATSIVGAYFYGLFKSVANAEDTDPE